jgi:hypothetical protein
MWFLRLLVFGFTLSQPGARLPEASPNHCDDWGTLVCALASNVLHAHLQHCSK